VLRGIVTDVLDAVAPADRCDAVADLATPWTALTIARVVAAPAEDADRPAEWSQLIQRQFDGPSLLADRAGIERACEQFYAWCDELLARERAQPGDDLVSQLVAVEEQGDRLSDVELVHLVLHVLIGVVDTTAAQLAHALHLFAQHREQWTLLAGRPELVPQAVEEVLRHEPVTPFTARVTTEEVVLRDVVFPAGTGAGQLRHGPPPRRLGRMTPDERRALVLARTRLQAPPVVPELQLHLADDMDEAWHGLQEELDDGNLPPPFWAFAWLGGQALARHVLDHPDEVAGRQVLDLATGSGLVALAARLAGAAEVTAVDVDPFAATAAELNASANDLVLDVRAADLLDEPPPTVDVVLAGDVFYDRAMTDRVLPWLSDAARQGARVLVGDPGRHYLPRALLEELGSLDVPTTRDLEGVEVKRVRVYAFPPVFQAGHATG
jgi:predicted nicotinamide N-methyase